MVVWPESRRARETVRGDEEGPNARVGRAPRPLHRSPQPHGSCRPKDTVSLGAIRLHGGQGDADRDLRDSSMASGLGRRGPPQVQAGSFRSYADCVPREANLAPFETEVDLRPADRDASRR